MGWLFDSKAQDEDDDARERAERRDEDEALELRLRAEDLRRKANKTTKGGNR